MITLDAQGRPLGWLEPEEAAFYSECVSNVRKGIVVEVGVWLGRSLSVVAPICRANENRLVAVDHWLGSQGLEKTAAQMDVFAAFQENMRSLGCLNQIEILRTDSTEAATNFSDETLDLVFLDGDHSYEGVRGDIEAWWPKLKDNGTLLGHDFGSAWPGVVRAVEERFKRPDEVRGTVWRVRKVPSKPQCLRFH